MSAFRAAGTAKKVGSGNLSSIGLPTGHTLNDYLLLVVVAHDNKALGTPTGWTKIVDNQISTTLHLAVFSRIDNGSVTAPTVTHSAGDSAVAQIFAWSGTATTSPEEVIGTVASASGSGGSGTLTFNGITPTHTNSRIIAIAAESVGATDGGGASYYSGWSGTDPTFTERGDTVSVLGAGEASLGLADGLTTDGAATGSRTVSLSSLSTGTWNAQGVLIAITDASPTGGGGGAQTISLGHISSGEAVRGANLSPGAVTLPIGHITSGAAVRGVALQPGAVTISAGHIGSGAAVRGVALRPTISLGHIGSTASVRGAALSPGPVIVGAGRIGSSAGVRGVQLSAGPVTVSTGKVGTGAAVRGVALTPGPVTISLGHVPSGAAVRGVSLGSTGLVINLGKITAGAVVQGSRPRTYRVPKFGFYT